MKILHVIDSEGFYGAEAVIVDLAAEQKKQGAGVTILNMRPCPIGEMSIETAAIKQGLEFCVVPVNPGLDFKGAKKIVRHARDNHFDIIHCHGYKANILIGLIPRFVRKLPVITTVHGWCSTNRFSKLWLFEQLDLFALKFVDAVVVVNKAMLNHPRLKRSSLNIHVVNNGIPKIDFAPLLSLDQEIVDFCKTRGFVVGAIGRLSKEKGFNLLLEMMHYFEAPEIDLNLVIIGDGDERPALESLIEKYGLEDRVFLAGYKEKARDYLPLFDLFVMPSYTEGLPITLLEAMQAGVPIVATEVGGIPEVLKNGEAGILVPPGDVTRLETAISSIVENRQLRDGFVSEAVLEVADKYSSHKVAENYFVIYRECLSSYALF